MTGKTVRSGLAISTALLVGIAVSSPALSAEETKDFYCNAAPGVMCTITTDVNQQHMKLTARGHCGTKAENTAPKYTHCSSPNVEIQCYDNPNSCYCNPHEQKTKYKAKVYVQC